MLKSTVFSSFKGRLCLLVGFFLVVVLGFSVVMLVRNRLIKEEIQQLLKVRLHVRKNLSNAKLDVLHTQAKVRQSIVRQTPLPDKSLKVFYQQCSSLDTLQGILADTNRTLINALEVDLLKLTQDYHVADSIWNLHLTEKRQDIARFYAIDPHTDLLRRATQEEAADLLSDTVIETFIEAEEAYYKGAFLNYTHPGFSGKGYADYSNAEADFIEWKFETSQRGPHLLRFRYANGSKKPRPLSILVDGNLLDSVWTFPTVKIEDWQTWETLDRRLPSLDTGTHTVRAIANGHSGPNIDCLTIIAPVASADKSQMNVPVDYPGVTNSLSLSVLIKQVTNNTNDVVVGNAIEDLIRNSLFKYQESLDRVVKQNELLLRRDLARLQNQLRRTNTFNFVTSALVTLLTILAAYVLLRSLNKSIAYPVEQLGKLCLGHTTMASATPDELNVVIQASNKLSEYLNRASEFARKIGEGDLQQPFDKASDDDVLGNALLQMRDKLRALAKEDERRNWQTEGLAQFAEMLRKDFEDQQSLVISIITALVKYVKANQGGLFLINGDNEESFLEMVGCYAYDRRKYLTKRIELGEGLVGQVFLEGETTYLVDVPDNYVTIRSGLGGANPQSLLLIPIKTDTETLGVLELASFGKFAEHKIEFIEKVTEMVASSVQNIRINERTRLLLAETQVQTQTLREQEEELRQNMEEMQTTQEQMRRDAQLDNNATK